MKSDEYWHKGLTTRQNPLMEAVVTLDPQFIDAWSTAGWHWAYNIYADIELNPKYKNNPKMMRKLQEQAIETGLDYLRRGSEQNPEKYRLWFEHGWTRAKKPVTTTKKPSPCIARRAHKAMHARSKSILWSMASEPR